MNKADISILIALYYHTPAIQLAESIHSILLNTIQPREIIIVLDGPVSNHTELLLNLFSRLPHFIIVRLPTNIGHALALNEGLKRCSSTFIMRLDPDDILVERAIEIHSQYHTKLPDYDIYNSSLIETLSTTVYSKKPLCFYKPLPKSSSTALSFLPYLNTINHPCVSFKRESITSIGMYEPFPGFDDYLLWLKCLNQRLKLFAIPMPTVYMRRDSFSTRRHGLKYAIAEQFFFFSCFQRNLIGFFPLLISLARFPVRILPTSISNYLYRLSRKPVHTSPLPLPWGPSHILSIPEYLHVLQMLLQ